MGVGEGRGRAGSGVGGLQRVLRGGALERAGGGTARVRHRSYSALVAQRGGRGGQAAYQGEWKGGRMEGWGLLLGADGDSVWEGYFKAGRPVRPWWVL